MVDDIGEAEGALSCTTDRKSCCSNESSADIGSWFLPNGSKIETNYSQILYVSLGHQVVGPNRVNHSRDLLPTGVYHCEMMDDG